MVVNGIELPLPSVIIEERPKIKAIIIGAVGLGVTGRRKNRHFVAIYRVASVEVLDFFSDLEKKQQHKHHL